MKEKTSLEKQGSLVLRILLIISVVLVVIVLAGGFVVIKRMMNQPESQPQPPAARAKIPSPPPASEPTGGVDKDGKEGDQQTVGGLKAEAAADFSDGAAEPSPSESPEATPLEPVAPVAEKETPQEKTTDQKAPTPADEKTETGPPPSAATDTPEAPQALPEPQKPEGRLAVQDVPEPDKALPGKDEAKPTASGESEQDESTSPPSDAPIRKGLAIQVASYRTKAFAEARMKELNQKGYNAFIHQTIDKNQQPWYAVRLGHFENRREADAFLLRFNKEENAEAIVIHQK